EAVKPAGKEATAILRDRHHLRPEEEDDFNIRNPEDIIQAQLEASKTLTVLLIAIASISLIVGGIGIMNVMLVSVTERTREIGVRVAVGATEEAIQLQFLGESVMLSLVGGAAGVLFGVVVVAGVFAAFGLNHNNAPQHFTAKVEKGEIRDVVEATGMINAVITVQVGSQVSGTISKLYVDFNSRVRKGDIVALIDPALFKGALLQATADLENAKANLVAARANLEKAKASLVQTKADYDRTAGLFKDGILSQQQLDLAKANYDSANATVGGAVADVTQAEAQVSQKEAAVTVA